MIAELFSVASVSVFSGASPVLESPVAASTTSVLTESATTLPSLIVKMIFDAISYPSGAAFSVSVYVPSARLLISVGASPDTNVIVVLSSDTVAVVPSTLSSVKSIAFPSASLPVSVSVAPSSSFPPPTACLLILTSVLGSAPSTIVMIAFFPSTDAVTSAPFTTPFSIVNVISVATTYPFGAAFSVSVYVPSGSA